MKQLLTILAIFASVSASAQGLFEVTGDRGTELVSCASVRYVRATGDGSSVLTLENRRTLFADEAIDTVIERSCGEMVKFIESRTGDTIAINVNIIRSVASAGAAITTVLLEPGGNVVVAGSYATVSAAVEGCAATGSGMGISGDGEQYEVAIFNGDGTIYGDDEFRIKGDTMYLHQATFVAGTSPLSSLESRFANAIPGMDKVNSLFDPTSPINAMHWQEEGDGDWVTNVSTSFGGIILSEVDGGGGGNPRMQFHSARANSTLDPIAPNAGDYFFRIRGIKHKGLTTNYPIYDNGAGGYFIGGVVDTVYGSGNLSGRLVFYTFDNQSNWNGGTERMRIGRTGDIRYSAYTSARNDSGTPANVLSVDASGNMQTHPWTDMFLSGSGTLDFGSTSAGGTATLTISVTGAADGDPVMLGVPNGSSGSGAVYTAWVSATNTVTVQLYNSSASPLDPASGTFKVKVAKW